MALITPPIKNIKEVTVSLKEQILKGDVHTIDEMRAWLKPFVYAIQNVGIHISLQTSYIRHRKDEHGYGC